MTPDEERLLDEVMRYIGDDEEARMFMIRLVADRDGLKKWKREAEKRMDVTKVDMHPATTNLVGEFAHALAKKLAAAERKYGYSDQWAKPDWMDECRAKLMEHVAKGDPLDVAAYCAFLWHHNASTATPPNTEREDDAVLLLEEFCWWLSADLPELHRVKAERIGAAVARFFAGRKREGV